MKLLALPPLFQLRVRGILFAGLLRVFEPDYALYQAPLTRFERTETRTGTRATLALVASKYGAHDGDQFLCWRSLMFD